MTTTTAATSQRGSAIVISDLHLAAGRHDPFSDDEALVSFLQAVEHWGAAGASLRLVLLGDTLDFTLVEHDGRRLDRSVAGALARLERIAAAHAGVFAALGRVARAGVALDIVAGNHDLELLSPTVLERLRSLLGVGEGALTLHPWIVHLPGLAYLEHGQQHHDLNRVPGLLAAGEHGTPAPPAGTIYGEHLLALADALGAELPIERISARGVMAAARRRPSRLGRALAPTVGAARGLTRCERAARRARSASAGATALRGRPSGLPSATLAELDRAAASTPTGAMRRRLTTRAGSEPYMVAAARAAHELLAEAGQALPFYVLAHTHAADDRPLTAQADGPRYLNAGTWSRLAPEHAPRRCYVELRSDGGRPSAQLLHWPG